MSPARIDNFVGDDYAYAGYLLGLLAGTLVGCIHQLEEQVKEIHQGSSPPRTHIVLELKCSTTPTRLQIDTPNKTGQRASSERPNWEERTKCFFAGLPSTEDQWDKKRREAGLHDEIDIRFTARCLATACLEGIPFTNHTQEIELQDSLLHFALNAGKALVGANSYSNISHFLSFIFVATCVVAKQQGHDVDDAQQKFEESCGKTGKKKTPKALTNDRALVVWLLQEMQRQYRRGLSHRAFELFFLSMYRFNLP